MNPHIMIIDDDQEFNLLFSRLLTKNGFHIDTFSNPDLFLSKLKQHKPHVCVIDLNLEKNFGAGFQIIKAIRNKVDRDLPLVVMSRRSSNKDITYAFEVGATDYIQKPFDESIFISKIRPYLPNQEISSQLPYFKVPSGFSDCEITCDFEISAVSEFAITLISPHFMSRGSSFLLKGRFLTELTGIVKPTLFTVSKSEFNSESRMYEMEAEFNTDDKDLLANIRNWLATNSRKA